MYFLKFLSNFIEKNLKQCIKNAIEQSPWCRPQSPWNENQICLMSSRRGSHVIWNVKMSVFFLSLKYFSVKSFWFLILAFVSLNNTVWQSDCMRIPIWSDYTCMIEWYEHPPYDQDHTRMVWIPIWSVTYITDKISKQFCLKMIILSTVLNWL